MSHYVIKSLGEYIDRGARRDIAHTVKYDKAYFEFNDKNDEQDFSIGYFIPGMRRMAALMRAIPDIDDAEAAACALYEKA